jgi:hypothetical protein
MSSPSQLFEPPARVIVEGALDRGARTSACARPFLLELADERSRRYPPRLLARRRPDRAIRGDDRHGLARAVICREALDESVRVLGKVNFERPNVRVRASSIEDDHAAGPLQGDVARQAVDELVPVTEVAGVQDVVAVEEKEHGAELELS